MLTSLSLQRSSCLGTTLCNLLTRSELAGIPNLTTARRHTMPITSYRGRQALLLRSHHSPPSPQAIRAGRSHPIPDQEHPSFSRYNSKAQSVAYISQTPGSSYPSSPAHHPVGAQQGYPPDECGREVICNERLRAGPARASTCTGTEVPPPPSTGTQTRDTQGSH